MIESVIAVLGDRTNSIIEKANSVLSVVNEKYEDVIRTRFVDGIKRSYEFQKRTFGNAQSYSLATANKSSESIFSTVYNMLKSKKSNSLPFLEALAKSFEAFDLSQIEVCPELPLS